MTVLGVGISYGLATLFAMFSGMPIAFALGAVAVVFMGIYMPAAISPYGIHIGGANVEFEVCPSTQAS